MAQQNIIVVGGGVVGLATACALAAEPKVQVTVLERFTVGHGWSSSHGLSRAIRHEYGPDAIYTEMVARSLVLWAELARETGRQLYTETGVLTLGQPDDGHTLAGYAVMRAAGLPVELLTPTKCVQRFPAFTPTDYAAITYNPRGGGCCMPRPAWRHSPNDCGHAASSATECRCAVWFRTARVGA